MSNYKPQELFHNRYRLLQHVGVGGMSEVWTAMDENGADDEVIALKIFSHHSDKNSLRDEYALMRKFNHPNLLRPDYFGVDEATGAPFMVMKYYSNGSASKIINNSNYVIKPIDEKLIARFIFSVSNALDTIQNHESRIIHQDIKPDNFLINDDGSFVLADFGVSTISKATRQIKQTQGQFPGSTAYVAPERFNAAPPRFSQDIFSLGVTIYEILTGVLPFQDYGGQRLNQGFPVPDLDPAFGYSSRLNALSKRCMDLEPEARPLVVDLVSWSKFHIENGFWPEIPEVDVAAIKAEKKYNSSCLIFDRISQQKLNELDINELMGCISDFREVNRLKNHFHDVNQKIDALNGKKEKRERFLVLVETLHLYKGLSNVANDDLLALKRKFENYKGEISDSYFDSIIHDIDLLSKKESAEDVNRLELVNLLNKSIYEIDLKYTTSFIQQNKEGEQNLSLYFQLEEKVKQAKKFRDAKEDCDRELSKLIHELNVTQAHFFISVLNPHRVFLGEQYFISAQRKIDNAKTYNNINEGCSNLSYELFNDNISSSEINTIISQISALIKKSDQLIKIHNNNSHLIDLKDSLIQLKIKAENKLKSNEKGTKDKTSSELIKEANEYLQLVNHYILYQNYTRKTLKINLSQIKISIENYDSIDIKSEEIERNNRRATELKEIIIEELRRKRRGIIWWFVRGAAAAGIILLLVLNFPFKQTELGEETFVVTSDSVKNVTEVKPIHDEDGNPVKVTDSKTDIAQLDKNGEEKNVNKIEVNDDKTIIVTDDKNNKIIEDNNQMPKIKDTPKKDEKIVSKTTELPANNNNVKEDKLDPKIPIDETSSFYISIYSDCPSNIFKNSRKPIVLYSNIKGFGKVVWEQIEGPKIKIESNSTEKFTFYPTKEDTYKFSISLIYKNGVKKDYHTLTIKNTCSDCCKP